MTVGILHVCSKKKNNYISVIINMIFNSAGWCNILMLLAIHPTNQPDWLADWFIQHGIAFKIFWFAWLSKCSVFDFFVALYFQISLWLLVWRLSRFFRGFSSTSSSSSLVFMAVLWLFTKIRFFFLFFIFVWYFVCCFVLCFSFVSFVHTTS